MKSFSNSNLSYNPYAEGTIENQIYKLVKNNISSKNGNDIKGYKPIIENFISLLDTEIKNYEISVLESLKMGNIEPVENPNIIEDDNISALINSMKSDNVDFNDDEIIKTINHKDSLKESLSENDINNILKIIKS